MKGDFVFDERSAESTMARYVQQGVPYCGDYEHMSLVRPPIKAPNSITEFVPEIRQDSTGKPELWAANVHWTDDAKAELEAGHYRLYSPAFMPDLDADGNPTPDNHIDYLINVSLTNLPATYGLQPLVAASAAQTSTGDPPMEELKAMAEKLAASEKEREEFKALCQKMGATVQKLTGKSFDDWAKEESDEHEALSESDEEKALRKKSVPELKTELKALTALKAKLVDLTGKVDPTDALALVALSLGQAKELVALKATMEAERVTALKTEFEGLLTQAVTGGKLPPAGPVSKEFFVSLAADFGVEKALPMLKKAIPSEAIVQLTAPREPNPSSAVSEAQITVASMCGGRFGGVEQFKAQRIAEEKERAGAPTT
jgi:phage I-like protein